MLRPVPQLFRFRVFCKRDEMSEVHPIANSQPLTSAGLKSSLNEKNICQACFTIEGGFAKVGNRLRNEHKVGQSSPSSPPPESSAEFRTSRRKNLRYFILFPFPKQSFALKPSQSLLSILEAWVSNFAVPTAIMLVRLNFILAFVLFAINAMLLAKQIAAKYVILYAFLKQRERKKGGEGSSEKPPQRNVIQTFTLPAHPS